MSSPKKPQAAAHGPQWQPELPSPLPGPMDPAVLAVRFATELERLGGRSYQAESCEASADIPS